MNLKEMFNINNRKKNDLFYTILASMVGSAVLQLIAYPVIANHFGIDTVGTILFFMGIIYVVPQAIGHALSNTRLLIRKDQDTTNGDYFLPLLFGAVVSFLSCVAVGYAVTNNLPFSAFYGVFSVLYMLKIYAGVEYRLAMDFKGLFVYYLISAIGYLAGLVLYFVTDLWLMIFLVGEAAALLFICIKGNIFKKVKKVLPSVFVAKTVAPFIWSAFIRDVVAQFDRVIIMPILSPAVVTQYNAVSIVAKTMQVLVSPLNTLMMTYMTQRNWKLVKKTYHAIVMGCLGIGAVFYVLCLAVTPLFIRLFYPSVYDAIIAYSPAINLGLVLLFISSLLMVVLMSQGELKELSIIQTIWGGGYIVAAFLATTSYGLWGLAFATIAANGARFVLLLIVSNWKLKQKYDAR